MHNSHRNYKNPKISLEDEDYDDENLDIEETINTLDEDLEEN